MRITALHISQWAGRREAQSELPYGGLCIVLRERWRSPYLQAKQSLSPIGMARCSQITGRVGSPRALPAGRCRVTSASAPKLPSTTPSGRSSALLPPPRCERTPSLQSTALSGATLQDSAGELKQLFLPYRSLLHGRLF